MRDKKATLPPFAERLYAALTHYSLVEKWERLKPICKLYTVKLPENWTLWRREGRWWQKCSLEAAARVPTRES